MNPSLAGMAFVYKAKVSLKPIKFTYILGKKKQADKKGRIFFHKIGNHI